MTKQEFNKLFKEVVCDLAEEENWELKFSSIRRNNEMRDAVCICPSANASMRVIYADSFYEDGFDVKYINELRDGIKELVQKSEGFSVSPEHIHTAVVSYEGNEEWLEHVPHRRIQDLALYAKLTDGNGGYMDVTDQILHQMKMTKEEMLSIAKEHTRKQATLIGITDVMFMHTIFANDPVEMDWNKELEPDLFYVLSTENGMDGAALIGDEKILKRAHEKIQEDFYILPSSIHEILLLPKAGMEGDVDTLTQMVRSINAEEVPVQLQLSNRVYQYDGKRMTLAVHEAVELDMHQTNTYRRTR